MIRYIEAELLTSYPHPMFSPNPHIVNESYNPRRRHMARHRSHLRQRQQHTRRSATPSIALERVKHTKQSATVDTKRQNMKKRKAQEQRKRRAQAAMRQRRERWGAIALETQNIVLGDGKYVEERLVPAVTSEDTQSSDAQGPVTSVIHIPHDIAPLILLSRQRTIAYEHTSGLLALWKDTQPQVRFPSVQVEFSRKSTLNVARQLALSRRTNSQMSTDIGVLSTASSKRNTSHLVGSSEQEDVIKRTSSLLANLTSPAAQTVYNIHKDFQKADGSGLQDHAMLYSPGVVVFRKDCDDASPDSDHSSQSRKHRDLVGGDFIPPYTVNVVSAAPVNVGMVFSKHRIQPGEESFFEDGIRSSMKDRMARALRAFELNGDKVLVLGAFGCSLQNKVEAVASIWAELLDCGETVGEVNQEARFKHSFEKVIFAIPGKLFEPFKRAYEMRILEEQLTNATLQN